MTTEAELLRAICERPADNTVRLVYADWLEERNGPGDLERAGVIRTDYLIVQLLEGAASLESSARKYPVTAPDGTTISELRRRRNALFDAVHPLVWGESALGPLNSAGRYHESHGAVYCQLEFGVAVVTFGRGLAISIEMTVNDFFFGNTGRLFSQSPITEVTLADMHPHCREYGGGYETWTWHRNDFPTEVRQSFWDVMCDGLGDLYRFTEDYEHASAYRRLSVACVTWGRRLAGLPPL